MKFRLLRCFMIAFACIVGTCGVSVWADDTAVCDAGQYLDGEECKDCPIEDVIGEDKLYQFGDSGIGIESCTVKLNLAKSNCAERTNVVYRYSESEFGYVLDVYNYQVVPDDGFVGLYSSPDSAPEYLDYDTADHCGSDCPLGKYINENNMCESCPLEGTNAEGKVKSNETDTEPYVFVKYADGKGERSCAVKLSSGHSCDNNTFVLYVYDIVKNKYVRTRADVYPTGNSIINDVWPAEDELGTDFCTSCGGTTWPSTDSNGQQRPFHEYYNGTPFNVENKCTSCGKPGYYLYFSLNSFGCDVCRAGHYCPGSVIKENDDGNRVCLRDDKGECLRGYMGAIIWDYDPKTSRQELSCPENTYSEEGASKCLSCAPGYSTAQSGPAEDGYDGLCLRRENGYGVRCISSDACKLTMSFLSDGGPNSRPFSLGDNVKIESVNKSVIKTFSGVNPANMQVARPIDFDFDDDE